MADPNEDEERRLASGWGAKEPRPATDPDPIERAATEDRKLDDPEASANENEEANLAQGDPLSGNPPNG